MTSWYGRRGFSGLAAFVALTQTICRGHGPTEPYQTDLTLAVMAGDGQFGPPSQFLVDLLTVAVRTEDGGLPVDGIPLEWEIAEGPVGAQLTFNPMSATSVHRCGGFETAPRVLSFRVGTEHMVMRLYVTLLSFQWGKPSFG